MKETNAIFVYLTIMISLTFGISTAVYAERYPFNSEVWEIEATESGVVQHLGKQALMLKGGSALIEGLELTNGVIEFDISVTPERGFMGGLFRVQDQANFEHFYIRPHQSGNPDANQYTPVFNGVSGWQLYHGEGFGAPVEYQYNKWMHIKLVYSGSQAEVYIDSEAPVVVINALKRELASGGVGVNSSGFSTAYFANFEASELTESDAFSHSPQADSNLLKETVSSWLVSDPLDGQSLAGVQYLSEQQKTVQHWTPVTAEAAGITNLARAHGLQPGKDTVFARLAVNSEKEQLKGLSFGYSDAVAVYVNGRLFYTGNNRYESRDYRYLGTIGLFQKVFIHLQAGDNEIWFAVTEAFGGWGIQAQFDNLEGIIIKQH